MGGPGARLAYLLGRQSLQLVGYRAEHMHAGAQQ